MLENISKLKYNMAYEPYINKPGFVGRQKAFGAGKLLRSI